MNNMTSLAWHTWHADTDPCRRAAETLTLHLNFPASREHIVLVCCHAGSLDQASPDQSSSAQFSSSQIRPAQHSPAQHHPVLSRPSQTGSSSPAKGDQRMWHGSLSSSPQQACLRLRKENNAREQPNPTAFYSYQSATSRHSLLRHSNVYYLARLVLQLCDAN